MDKDITNHRLGVVSTQIANIELPQDGFMLSSGARLPELQIAYETYGTLSPEHDNVIFICHALTGDAHVAGALDTEDGPRGWWDDMVGPGRGIDTDYYYVVCANILGGCRGTTGPRSINPQTGKPYGITFPRFSVCDVVRAHRLLLQHLGIKRLAAVVGGSFGGMQALEWTLRYPDEIDRCICIASAASLSAQALAFDIVGRSAITGDPDWAGGHYLAEGRHPRRGLALARMIGHITYLSSGMMARKFGRERGRCINDGDKTDFRSDFQVASYLDYQGEKFVNRFDANSYLYITDAMDEYDLAEQHGSPEEAFAKLKARTLIVALSEDWLFPPTQSIELANALLRSEKSVSYCRLHAPHGHDAFLVDIAHLAETIRAFLPWVRSHAVDVAPGDSPDPRVGVDSREHARIASMIRPGSRVLDIGCGRGELLERVIRERDATGLGVDIDIRQVIQGIDAGLDMFQADIDSGLAMIPDRAYDYAVLSETLQVVRHPQAVLREMLRVAREGIVSFPNFANWRHRLRLGMGRMPKGGALPFEWYDTPNIHLFTLRDFITLCRQEDITILETVCTADHHVGRWLTAAGMTNLGADRVLVRIARES